MLVIRNAQLDAFYQVAVDRYLEARIAYVERTFAEQFASLQREGVEALVRDAIARAKVYGVEDDAQVDRFLHLVLTLGAKFDSQPETLWIAKIFGDHSIDERAKMDLVFASPRLPEAARP